MPAKWKYVAAAILLCAGWLGAADEYPLKRLRQLTRLVDYEASWSPDGKQIVLISNRHGGLKVHVLDPASNKMGGDMQQLTTGPDEDDTPMWSPDGKQIVFVTIRENISDIFVMNADGTSIRQVTKHLGQNIHPMWSPDGTKILFNTTYFAGAAVKDDKAADAKRVIGEVRDDSIDLATIRPDGTGLERITTGGGYTYASYSPDGKYILHRKQHGETSQIFVMNADGTGDHKLSTEGKTDGWPAWSYDGKHILFSRDTMEGGFQIFMMNLDGSGVRQLTDAPGEYVNPRWSPDGKKILCGRRLGGVNLVLFDAPN